MSDTITSPNMSLPVPIVSQDPGPDWANNYNACLSIIDQHNHTSGSGVLLSQDSLNLTPAATSFNSLSFNNSNAFALRSVRFTAQSSALALVTDIGCLYEAGVDLYYNDGSGNQIRLTQGGSIVGTSGSITGLPSGTASAAYSGGTFIWQSATNTAANMDAGSYIYRNATASSKGLTLAPPNAMAADYGLVLPALPGVTSIMALDTSGNISAPYTVDNSTIVITANVIQVPTNGITSTQVLNTPPTIQRLTSGSGTYTKPASAKYLRIRMVGAGGGGSGNGASGTAAGNGGNTTFGTSLLTAAGGAGAPVGGGSNPGGAATINSPATTVVSEAGAAGGLGSVTTTTASTSTGGRGGTTPFGGPNESNGSVGGSGRVNTGSGGSGAAMSGTTSNIGGGGGGSGAYIEAIIAAPSTTYSYAVGAAGTAGVGVSLNGGAGGSGVIIVEEHYY